MKKLIKKVEKWADDKGILENGTFEKQALKTLEEAGELLVGVGKNNKYEIKDAIGDIMVTIIIQAKMQGMDIEDCLQCAYNVISKRKGEMINGTFVKN
jgi:NTP pyrophosphatase (non-canonical NTP hydrolase)